MSDYTTKQCGWCGGLGHTTDEHDAEPTYHSRDCRERMTAGASTEHRGCYVVQTGRPVKGGSDDGW